MSAIAGLIDWRGGPAGPAVRKALAALERHGRDGEGFWDGGGIALGWRQTILQAEDHVDSQPLSGGDGRFRLVFDGRLDNREDMARLLSLTPEVARIWPDSRYAMAAFAAWGPDCAARMDGDFAFAVWDDVRRELTLVRDHLGIRPLDYYVGQGFFAFASSPYGLLAMPSVPRAVDEETIVRLISVEPQKGERTFFRDIRRLGCAHILTATRDGFSSRCYWRIEDAPDVRYSREDDYVEALRSLLDEAVGRRLRTIHPVGSHLSSGWDSTTVSAVAAGRMAEDGRMLHAFTSVPAAGWVPTREISGQIADEGPLAALVAAKFANIEHTLVRNTARFEFAPLDWYGACFARPRHDVNNAGWYDLMHRTAREKGVRVMLAGVGGNRTVSHSGIDRYAKLLREGRLGMLVAEWSAAHRDGWSTKSLIGATFSPFLSAEGRDLVLRLMGRVRNNLLTQVMLDPAYVRRRKIDWRPPKGEYGTSDHHRATRQQRLRIATRNGRDFLQGYTLAAWDIDLRDPLWDRRIVEFCHGTPDDQFLKNGQRRRLLRRTMTGVLPEAIFVQKNRGRLAADWYAAAAGAQAELLEETELLAQHPQTSVILDTARMRTLIATWKPELIVSGPRTYFLHQRLLEAVTIGRFMRLQSI